MLATWQHLRRTSRLKGKLKFREISPTAKVWKILDNKGEEIALIFAETCCSTTVNSPKFEFLDEHGKVIAIVDTTNALMQNHKPITEE